MKKTLAAFLSLVLALGLTACGGTPTAVSDAADVSAPASSTAAESTPNAKVDEHTVEAIKAKGKIVFATESQYAPFAFKDDKGNIIGLEPVFMKAIANDLGVELEIMDISFDAVIPAVQSGAADVGIAGLSPTAERKKSVDMTDPYTGGAQCMVVKAEDVDKYNTAADLKGLLIACQKGALQQTIGEQQFAESELKLLPKVPNCVQELKAGNCAAVLMDDTSAQQYVKNNPDLAISKVPVEIDPAELGSAAAVLKGNTDLLNFLNEEIKKYSESGDLNAWFTTAQEQAAKLGIE